MFKISKQARNFLRAGRSLRADSITYMLRTCNADLVSRNNRFVCPKEGCVEATDWSPTAECGAGLHGLLLGAGNVNLLSADAVWLVCAVWRADVVDLKGKVKVPRACVVYAGTRDEATSLLYKLGAPACCYVTASAGDGSTLTAGFGSTLTAGHYSTLTAGARSTLTAGFDSTLQAGDDSTLTAGHRSTLQAGADSTLQAGYGSTLTAGFGSRLTAGADSTLHAGNLSTLHAGNRSMLHAGNRSTLQAGKGSTLQAGERSTLQAGNGSKLTADFGSAFRYEYLDGTRMRTAVAYTGEDGIEPNVTYKCVDGKFLKVS